MHDLDARIGKLAVGLVALAVEPGEERHHVAEARQCKVQVAGAAVARPEVRRLDGVVHDEDAQAGAPVARAVGVHKRAALVGERKQGEKMESADAGQGPHTMLIAFDRLAPRHTCGGGTCPSSKCVAQRPMKTGRDSSMRVLEPPCTAARGAATGRAECDTISDTHRAI